MNDNYFSEFADYSSSDFSSDSSQENRSKKVKFNPVNEKYYYNNKEKQENSNSGNQGNSLNYSSDENNNDVEDFNNKDVISPLTSDDNNNTPHLPKTPLNEAVNEIIDGLPDNDKRKPLENENKTNKNIPKENLVFKTPVFKERNDFDENYKKRKFTHEEIQAKRKIKNDLIKSLAVYNIKDIDLASKSNNYLESLLNSKKLISNISTNSKVLKTAYLTAMSGIEMGSQKLGKMKSISLKIDPNSLMKYVPVLNLDGFSKSISMQYDSDLKEIMDRITERYFCGELNPILQLGAVTIEAMIKHSLFNSVSSKYTDEELINAYIYSKTKVLNQNNSVKENPNLKENNTTNDFQNSTINKESEKELEEEYEMEEKENDIEIESEVEID